MSSPRYQLHTFHQRKDEQGGGRVRADSEHGRLTVLPAEGFSAFGAHDVPDCVQSGGHWAVFWRAEGDVDAGR